MGESVLRASGENRWRRLYVAVLGESSLGRFVRSRPRRHSIQQSAARIDATSRHLSCEPGTAEGKEESEEEEEKKATEGDGNRNNPRAAQPRVMASASPHFWCQNIRWEMPEFIGRARATQVPRHI